LGPTSTIENTLSMPKNKGISGSGSDVNLTKLTILGNQSGSPAKSPKSPKFNPGNKVRALSPLNKDTVTEGAEGVVTGVGKKAG